MIWYIWWPFLSRDVTFTFNELDELIYKDAPDLFQIQWSWTRRAPFWHNHRHGDAGLPDPVSRHRRHLISVSPLKVTGDTSPLILRALLINKWDKIHKSANYFLRVMVRLLVSFLLQNGRFAFASRWPTSFTETKYAEAVTVSLLWPAMSPFYIFT